MSEIKTITITTSTEGLGDLPEELYTETCEAMLKNHFPGAEIDFEASCRYMSTKIDVSMDGLELASVEELMAHDKVTEEVGSILQDAFHAACSAA